MVKELFAETLMFEGAEGARDHARVEPSEEPPEAESVTLLMLAKLPQKALVR